ncbi:MULTISPECIES: hypothetical protein [unclassified Shewanella]|uniref:hypothetical protein n=1 Tax=unclassified Shewanella TaxID=196818 RepID=UPI0021D8CD01|nr:MULTISPECIES: hypothetical protein [unclassified Shewanella]MCU8036379.1 hypothetical protein [Shewanella sp. SM71]MCU8058033.1 hypothetical protein [Shewanella sp. SM35]MCU8066863.1 hypothetical protein [Shewanella sp. SM34]MCU8085732.1 hypothetical protein [Shewanella sp. SM23]MCU8098325.1 hypothetical protein [Shewanella sp. SM102]
MIDFEKRLKSLKERRQGTRERAIYESMESLSANNAIQRGVDVRKSESFESLNEVAGVKYTIGAMAAVEPASTKVSISEGNRVADSLMNSLQNSGETVTKRLQGSVALDIHIKGHSDVDMLIIVTNPVNIELPKVNPNRYSPATDPRNLIDIVKDVRSKSERILPVNFPKAEVDISGNKSIALEGGSLKRKVDIVPAIWFDTTKYQRSDQESDRGIKIYHKSNHEFHLNYPFTHIKMINDKDSLYAGNLKSVIRLLKNMIADMPDYKKRTVKSLSSYDLAAIAFHMNADLNVPSYMKLALVEKTRAHLAFLNSVKAYRDTLNVPDGSRKIFNEENKTEALEILTNEVSDLAKAIYEELRPFSTGYDANVILNKSVF